ncbi:MAG: hypothetical protein JSR47_20945 [Proteobacteria bacterium]|nr:hypothetical protein [Pseudomonadota bacterium]
MSFRYEGTIRVVLCVLSILVGFAVLEVGCRLWHGPGWLFTWPNLVAQERADPVADMWRNYIYDPVSGYALRPHLATPDLHTDEGGFRVVPGSVPPSPARAPILASGDSFTMGDEVRDDESWPAQLTSLHQRTVVNAGVAGYSLAQSVLRAEALAARLMPRAIVVGFIADDIERGAYSRRFTMEMPYFVPSTDGGDITLANAPPSPVRDPRTTLTLTERVLGRSMLVDTIVRRLRLEEPWFADRRRALSNAEVERTVCPMMRRLAALGVPTIVVAQYDDDMWTGDSAARDEESRLTRLVLDCAAAAGLGTLDMFKITDAAVRAHGVAGLYKAQGHHTALGNRLTAEALSDALTRLVPP